MLCTYYAVCCVFIIRSVAAQCGDHRLSKFPRIDHDYQLTGVPNVYIAGVAAHSLDFRKSAGGFIHGLRYTGTSSPCQLKTFVNEVKVKVHSLTADIYTIPLPFVIYT